MRDYKREVVTGLVVLLLLIFISPAALCKPSEGSPGSPDQGQEDPKKPQEPGPDEPKQPGKPDEPQEPGPDEPKQPGKPDEPQNPKDTQFQIIIVPAEATLAVREQLQFGFRVQAQNGEDVDTTGFEFSWQVMGNIGSISPDGLFVASDSPGRGMVRISLRTHDKQMTSYALVKIAEGGAPPGPKKRITVAVIPGSAVVAPGTTQGFSVEPSGINEWRVIPPRIGSVSADQDGQVIFTASQNSGRGILVASVQTDDGVGTGRSNIVVDADKTKFPKSEIKLVIHPKHAQVEKAGSTDFEVQIAGNKDDYANVIEWEVSPSELGNLVSDGYRATFVAGTVLAGRALVTAKIITDSGIGMDWATVDIGLTGGKPSSKTKLAVVPEEMSMKVGESMVFTSDIVGEDGLTSWSVAPKRIGTIDESGLFTATEPGWGLIIAKANVERGIAVGRGRIFVGTESSTPLRMAISPQDAEASTNGPPMNFAVQITDINGNPVAGVPVQWKVVPGHMGSIDQAGTFSPGNQPGHALVTARVENAGATGMAQARITISTQTRNGRLIVSVTGPTSLKVGTPYTYQASATDSENNPVGSAGTEFEWRVVPSSLGGVTGNGVTAIFTPDAAGRGVIMVEVKTSQGTGTGRISVTVEK